MPRKLNEPTCCIRTSINGEFLRMIIAIKTTGYGGKPEYAIIGIGDTFGVIFRIAVTPNHFLTFGIGQNFHCAAKRCSSEKTIVNATRTDTVYPLSVIILPVPLHGFFDAFVKGCGGGEADGGGKGGGVGARLIHVAWLHWQEFFFRLTPHNRLNA